MPEPKEEAEDETRSKSLPASRREHWVAQIEEWANARWGEGKWTQTQLAAELGLPDQGSWSQLKSGKGLGTRQLLRASKVLDRSVNDMLGLEYPASEAASRDQTIIINRARELVELLDSNKNFAFQGRMRTLLNDLRELLKLQTRPVHHVEKLMEPKRPRSRFPKDKTDASPRSRRKIA